MIDHLEIMSTIFHKESKEAQNQTGVSPSCKYQNMFSFHHITTENKLFFVSVNPRNNREEGFSFQDKEEQSRTL